MSPLPVFPAMKKLSENSPHGGNRATMKQRVARTSHVRVVKRQEVDLCNTARQPAFVAFGLPISEPLAPSAPGGSSLRATLRNTIVL